MNKNIIFFAILCAMPTLLYAQHTINGTVIDQQTGEPVVGAIIVIEGTNSNATTDNDGLFTLSSDKQFDNITVMRIGYLKREIAVTDMTQPLNIQLTPSAVQLTGIEVLGNSQLTRAQSIGALTPQDLGRASGLSLENSINTIPGVLMQSRTPFGGARISVRGYYPNFSQNSNGYGFQLLLNNIPVTDATGFTVMDDIDFSTLGSVEVIKGPSSSLYGSFIAGTVNLATAKAQPGGTSVSQQAIGGAHGLFRNNTMVQSSGDNSDIVVNYGHQTYDGFRPHDSSKKDYARFTGEFRTGNNQTVSTYASYNRSFEELSGEIDSADFYNKQAIDNPVYAANNSHIQIESFRAGATNSFRFNEHFNNQTTLFLTSHTMSQPFAHGFTDVNRFNFGGRSALGYQTQLGNVGMNGILGAAVQKTDYTSNGFNLNSNSPSDQQNYGLNYYLFTEWTIGLPEQFTVTVGGSLNKNEFGIRNMLKNKIINDTTSLTVKVFKATFTPRISVLKVFNDNVSVYASVSTGYTPPSLGSIIASDNSINLTLKPERAVQFELGTKGNLVGRKLSYQLALFDLENKDKLVSQKVGAVTFTTNVGKQRNRGAELSFSYLALDNKDETISLLRPWVSYTYSDFKYIKFKSDNNNNAATVDFSGNRVARVPRNVLNIGVDAGTSAGVYLYGSYQFVDKAPVTFDNSTSVNSYSLLNAKVGYRGKIVDYLALDVFAGGDNLTGSTYYTFIFVGPNYKGLAWAKDGGTGDGYIIPGPYKATFYGGATLSYAL